MISHTYIFFLKYDEKIDDFGLYTNIDIAMNEQVGVFKGVVTSNPKGNIQLVWREKIGD